MGLKIKNRCKMCGEASGSLLLCTECRMHFCRKCYAPKLLEPIPGLPELINTCPNCHSGEMRYLD